MAAGASAYGPDDKEAETEHDTRWKNITRENVVTSPGKRDNIERSSKTNNRLHTYKPCVVCTYTAVDMVLYNFVYYMDDDGCDCTQLVPQLPLVYQLIKYEQTKQKKCEEKRWMKLWSSLTAGNRRNKKDFSHRFRFTWWTRQMIVLYTAANHAGRSCNRVEPKWLTPHLHAPTTRNAKEKKKKSISTWLRLSLASVSLSSTVIT